MKLQYIIIIFLSSVVLIWACAPKPAMIPEPSREEELFSRAEKMFQEKTVFQSYKLNL